MTDYKAPLIELSCLELLRRMRAMIDELELLDRNIMLKATRSQMPPVADDDDIDVAVNRLCDEADDINRALSDCLRVLGTTTNAALFSALNLLMREALTNCCDRAEESSKERVH